MNLVGFCGTAFFSFTEGLDYFFLYEYFYVCHCTLFHPEYHLTIEKDYRSFIDIDS